jgi:CcmD family protein
VDDQKLKFLFWAYSLVWLIFIFYAWILSRRQARLKKELEDLKAKIHAPSPSASQPS